MGTGDSTDGPKGLEGLLESGNVENVGEDRDYGR